ncbi:MAG TPA: carboxypeptidase regulatory-like domain-containing protein [Pyrinomonadaceae bacterium]|nr:carboxypeptidase regulatory-like domain-containing protein [Pyrinomonadaceae bacterium]
MKVSLKFFGRAIVLALAFALSGLATAAAPQQPSTGTLRGQVMDEFGGVIVGATVTVVGAEGREKTAQSNNDGNYVVAGLAPGAYIVRAVSPGFALYENAEVVVAAGRTEPLNITLGVSLEKEEVTVASEGPVSIDNTNPGAIVLKGKDLEALPEDPDELAAALSALAGPAAGPNGGQITIDGFEGGRIPSRDSIREVRVNDNPLSAENDRPGFGGIQILTKPGTEKLRGSAGMTFNDESMNSRNPFLRSEKRPPFQFRQFNGNLSGSIVPRKSSFFVDFNRSETDDNDLVNGFVLDPLTGGPLPFNLAVLTPRRNWSFSPRVDYAINDSNTLIARYSYYHNDDQNLGVSQYSLPERAFDQVSSGHTLQLTETAVLNKTTVNETRFQLLRNRFEQDALNDGFAVNVFDAFSSGGATVGNSFNENNRWELTNVTTQARGNHSVKFGARLRGIRVSDFSENNFNGTFTFSSLEQYRQALEGSALPTQLSLVGGEPLSEISQVDFGGFVQDDWKVRPNLTLGGGLRYERQTNIESSFNVAPRVYLAWSPDGGVQQQAKTVIRLGFGIFYDRISENISLQALRFNGLGQQQFIISAPLPTDTSERAQRARELLGLFPDISSGAVPMPTVEELSGFALQQTTRQLADDATAPYSYISGIIVTRQLSKTATLNLFFSTYDTRHLLRSRNINAPLPNGLRPRPELGNIFQYETSATQSMKQLNISVSKQFHRAFSVNANYSIGKAQSSADFGGFPVNQYDLTGEYGRTSFDTRHRFVLFASLGVPVLKLALQPFLIANTGRPFNIITGVDNNRDGIINDRPAFADSHTAAADLRRTPWGDFDINPKPGQAIVPRNYGEGPGFFAVNMRVSRTFSFGDTAASRAAAQAREQQQAANRQQGGGGRGGNNRGGGQGGPGGGGPGRGPVPGGMGGGPMMMMMGAPGGGGEGKRYTLNFSLNFINLLNRTNLSSPVGNLSSPNFGQSLFSVGGFGGVGGNQAAGNRRIQASVRFSF